MRRLKKGQRVKWQNLRAETARKDEWRNGYYMRQGQKGTDTVLIGKYPGDKTGVIVSRNNVKPYEVIGDDEIMTQFGKDNIEALLALVRLALEKIIPNLLDQVKKDDQEPHLILFGGSYTVEPCGIDVESIAGFKEELGWSVTAWHYHHGTRLDPPDWSDSLVCTARSIHQAAALIVDTMYRCMADGFWESYGEEQMFAQWQQDEALAKEYFRTGARDYPSRH